MDEMTATIMKEETAYDYENVNIGTINEEFLKNLQEMCRRSWEARGFEIESENHGRQRNYYGGTQPMLQYNATARKTLKNA